MNKACPPKSIEHYLALPYHVVMYADEDGDIVASIQELDGCIAHGTDPVEAWKNLKDIQRAWIEDCLEAGEEVPEPEPEEELPSGKWVQRVPRTLHKRLVDAAKKDGVSLNQLVTSLLASSLMARSVAEYLGGTVATHHPVFHTLWERNAQVDWLISEPYRGDLLTNLGTIHRLLPAPKKKKDAYDPKDVTIYTHKEVAGSGSRR